ncbi:galactose-3-O-sulfotransferase 2 isoform X2 [Eurytemora carolleeae]|uniref:galactose-3-O-sulfotransferase 2 isoform X2 n=1 Tax=Eurytemora carolleeae TaxID=1294199 RepID=UPI000C75AAE2|nr:galactose-3-O-sulfotransferase 2 isoform X2 [Eurytemora carolleeae]|eukprot:XP_023344045.1 galactose-3-O-sulfotransferase 2-like isoform X2 [Eurytemora affinis]
MVSVGYQSLPGEDPDLDPGNQLTESSNQLIGSHVQISRRVSSSSATVLNFIPSYPCTPSRGFKRPCLIAFCVISTLAMLGFTQHIVDIRRTPIHPPNPLTEEKNMINFMNMIRGEEGSIDQGEEEDEKNHLPNSVEKVEKEAKVPNNTCSTPATKVGFLKTHKTASSTLQNIIFRYGLEQNWNFVMYPEGSHLGPPYNQYNLNRPFNSTWMNQVPWKPLVDAQGYNAFSLHSMWSKKEVKKILGEDAVYFTILRNPVDAFESLYNYVHFENNFKMNLETFIQLYIKNDIPVRRVHGYLGRNQQFWDLGRFASELTSVEEVRKKILEIEKEFDLVMISEDFESSLVLLSQQLCWPLNKFSSLPLNSRKASAVQVLSDKSRKLLKDWLWAEDMLYTYFRGILIKRKQEYGEEEIIKQKAKLRSLNNEVMKQCVENMSSKSEDLDPGFKPWSKDVLGFKINQTIPWCRYYALSEITFIDFLREQQLNRYEEFISKSESKFTDHDNHP